MSSLISRLLQMSSLPLGWEKKKADTGRVGSGSEELWRWSYLTRLNLPTTCDMHVFRPKSSKPGRRLLSPTTFAILVMLEQKFWVRPQTQESDSKISALLTFISHENFETHPEAQLIRQHTKWVLLQPRAY